MKTSLVALVFALGCRDVSKDIEAFAERACACADRACAERVVDDFAVFANKHKTAKGDERKAAKAAEKMMRCAIKTGADAAALAGKLRGLGD